MLDMDNLGKSLQQEIALKVVANLPEEQKRAIIAEGIAKVLRENFRIDWEVGKLLEREALIFAEEYIKQPEVQETLRQKAREVVDKIIDGIGKALAKEIEDGIKSKYVRLFSEKTFD